MVSFGFCSKSANHVILLCDSKMSELRVEGPQEESGKDEVRSCY